MMRRLLRLALFMSRLVAASPCRRQLLQLPIKDVRVYPDVAHSFMTGIPAKIGTPPQDVVLLPWPELNNTWLYDQQVPCDKTVVWNERMCNVRRGHPFDQDKSTSFHRAADIAAAGGAAVETSYEGAENGIPKLTGSGLAGTDTFALEGAEALKDFPIGIARLPWDHGYTVLHPLGLGSNSTYLNALRQAGKIPSRVFSIFWGRMWTDNPVDGAVVLGGYDEAKTIGEPFTAPLEYGDFGASSSGCWTGMKVRITDIQLNKRDGSDVSIMPANTDVPACIVPQRQNLMELPQSVVTKFEDVTGTKSNGTSDGLHWGARLFGSDSVFDGDLTIVLASGLKVRVPNSQFITPHLAMDSDGARILDRTKRDLLINGLGSQPATLGRYFLTSAYLMVDHDAKSFTLWRANPSTSSRLESVTHEGTASQCDDGRSVLQPSSPASAPVDSAGQPSAAVRGGAVAGGVVGASLLGLAAFLLLTWKRRRMRMRSRKANGDVAPQEVAAAHTEPKPAQLASAPHASTEHPAQGPHGSQATLEMRGQVYEMGGEDGNRATGR
ncbi:hypothetical protein CDD83_3633 [Cordyceps sp. RAO-2017]|nr:hypothetical protein CDD83_3633 [Cordyceps sp. RAO-2017]